jgi:ABC-type uncharacterized transport system substrate-binding protein
VTYRQHGSVAVETLQAATTTIPIVSTIMTDPSRFGITNLSRPGGNVTGLSTFSDILYAKRLELLKEMLPQARAAWRCFEHRPISVRSPWL